MRPITTRPASWRISPPRWGRSLGGVPKSTQAALQSPQPLPPEAVSDRSHQRDRRRSRRLDPGVGRLPCHPHALPFTDTIAFLLERLPPQARLVLMTREDPLLPVARLRARGQVVEIRQDDLRFSLEECRDFLHGVLGIRLAGEDVAALERRTEGWIAGLQLAALSMRGRSDLTGFIQSFTGSSRFILDYLVEEVFAQQPAEMQDFLLKTSILERLSGPLCDAVAEKTGSQALLERLEQANLFIVALDRSRRLVPLSPPVCRAAPPPPARSGPAPRSCSSSARQPVVPDGGFPRRGHPARPGRAGLGALGGAHRAGWRRPAQARGAGHPDRLVRETARGSDRLTTGAGAELRLGAGHVGAVRSGGGPVSEDRNDRRLHPAAAGAGGLGAGLRGTRQRR